MKNKIKDKRLCQKSGFFGKNIDFETFIWLNSPCCLLSKTVWFVEILMVFHSFIHYILMTLEIMSGVRSQVVSIFTGNNERADF